jgi:hypothetical protein
MGTVRRVVGAALMLAACREAPLERSLPPDDAGTADVSIGRCGRGTDATRDGCEVEARLHPPAIAHELAAGATTPRLESEAAILLDPHASRPVALRIAADASPLELRTVSGDETGAWSSAAAVFDSEGARSFVLFYDRIRGGGRFVRFEWSTPDRAPTTTVVMPDVAIAAGWDQVVPVACTRDCQRFVLHDVDTQTATTLDFVWREGSIATNQRDVATLDVVLKHVWRSAWERDGRATLTGLGSDGTIASFGVDVDSGRFVREHDAVSITKGGTTEASVDLACPIAERDGVARSFLARANGRARLVRLRESLDAVESDVDLGPLDPYSHAVTLANGVTLLYRSVDGSHAFARLEPDAATLDLRRGTLPLAGGLAHVTEFARAAE